MGTWNEQSATAFKNAGGKNLGSSISSVASGLQGMAEAFTSNSKIADTTGIENSIEDVAATKFGYGDYDSLMTAYDNLDTAEETNWKDIRGSSGGQQVMNTLKGVASGASAGASVGGPWGAVAGAVIGLGSGIAGIFTGNKKAKKEAARLNELAEAANERQTNNFQNNASNISQKMFNNAALNLAAYGGVLSSPDIDTYFKSKVRLSAFGGTIKQKNMRYFGLGNHYANGGFTGGGWNNGVIIVGKGGTHESNPYDGVLMGVDNEGTPNLVEENEVIFNDYVFSNRLKPTKEQLKKVLLPKKFEGKTYASIAKLIQKESEMNPNDYISLNSLMDGMTKLTTIQEETRAKEKKTNKFAKGGNMFDDGSFLPQVGDINNFAYFNDGKYDDSYISALNNLSLENDNELLTNLNKYYNEKMGTNLAVDQNFVDLTKRLGQDEKYGEFHKQIGQALTPRMLNTDIEVEDVPLEISDVDFDMPSDNFIVVRDPSDKLGKVSEIKGKATTKGAGLAKEKGKEKSSSTNFIEGLRYAPAIGSTLTALGDMFTKEDYTNPNLVRDAARQVRNVKSNPVGQYLRYNPFDTNYEQTKLGNLNASTQRNILNLASGNRGTAMASLLSTNAFATGQMGDLYRKASEYNEGQRRAITGFNRETDVFNSQQSLQSQAYNQEADRTRLSAAIQEANMRDNIETTLYNARSSNLSTALTNIGNVGRDSFNSNNAEKYLKASGLYDQYKAYMAKKGGKLNKKKNRRGLTF